MSDTEWVGCIKSALLILTRPTATRGDKWWHYNGNFWSSSPSNSHPVLSLPMPYCLLLPQSRPLGCPPVSISSLFLSQSSLFSVSFSHFFLGLRVFASFIPYLCLSLTLCSISLSFMRSLSSSLQFHFSLSVLHHLLPSLSPSSTSLLVYVPFPLFFF